MQKDPLEIKETLKDEDLRNETFHPKAQYLECEPSQQAAIQLVRFAFSEIYKCMDEILFDSRETSLAYTKLEEAQMWAIKGITRSNDYIGRWIK